MFKLLVWISIACYVSTAQLKPAKKVLTTTEIPKKPTLQVTKGTSEYIHSTKENANQATTVTETTTLSLFETTVLTEPVQDSEPQLCGKLSSISVTESNLTDDLNVTWSSDIFQNSTSTCVEIKATKFNTENCSHSFCTPKNLAEYSTLICPDNEYNITVQLNCTNGITAEKTISHKSKPGIPGKPKNFIVHAPSPNSLLLLWEEPIIKNGPIDGYVIKWKNRMTNKESRTERNTNLKYEISDLKPWTSYNVSISAFNINSTKHTLLSAEESRNISTKEDIPSEPLNCTITRFTNVSIYLKWLKPEVTNGVIQNYIVTYTDNESKTQNANRTITTKTKVIIKKLDPYTVYNISISASTSAGSGNSCELVQRTDTGVPLPPTDLKIEDKKHDYLLIKWIPPEEKKFQINGYRITWWLDIFENVTEKFINKEEFNITHLNPWTMYNIQISTYSKNLMNEILLSIPNNISEKTSAKIPAKPIFTEITTLSSKSIRVKWDNQDEIYPGPTSYELQVLEVPAECTGKLSYFVQNLTEGLEFWNNTSITVENLKPFTKYRFLVNAFNEAGYSSSNFSEKNSTPPDAPGQPQNFQINCKENPSIVFLTWNSPSTKNGLIVEYRIMYSFGNNVFSKEQQHTVPVKPESPCETVKYNTKVINLLPEANYRFSIRAKTDVVNKFGSAAMYENCILPAGVPPFPQNQSTLEVKESKEEEIILAWNPSMFSHSMGKIRYYSIILSEIERIGPPQSGIGVEEFPTWAEYTQNLVNIYQTTPSHWNPFQDDYDPLSCQNVTESALNYFLCTVGLEKNCTTKHYCNGKLKPGKQYGLKIRGYTNGGFSDTEYIILSTVAKKRKSSIVLPVTLSMIFIFLVSGMGLYYFFLKKKMLKPITINNIIYNTRVLFRKGSSVNSEPSVHISPVKTENVETEEKLKGPCDIMSFLDHIKLMSSDSNLKFSLEYEELKQASPFYPCSAAALDENRNKNRWMNIFPFDHSRVKLLPVDDDLGSDYVNASYIPGFSSPREYIASQGPLPHTIDDFWRMIWEQNVTMIIMLTECVERGKKKCEQYWPSDEEYVYYGDLKVKKRSVSNLPEYIIRVFDLILGTRQRIIRQMHFTRWPDFGCPESPHEMINFVKAVRAHLTHEDNGPILVHCSAGVGRTGTFIALDRLLQYVQHHACVDVYNTILEMRNYRINMVQTENQYIYIHNCIKQIILEKLKSSEEIHDDGEAAI